MALILTFVIESVAGRVYRESTMYDQDGAIRRETDRSAIRRVSRKVYRRLGGSGWRGMERRFDSR